MNKNMSFEEWTGGATEEELLESSKIIEKKYKFFLLISLIPIVNFVTMGLAIFCYNNLSLIRSRGRSNGNDVFRLILMLYAFFLPPIVVVNACAHVSKLGSMVLGLSNR